jgi:hypothetical protein
MHKVAELITVALIRWFEGQVHWSGSPEELWRQITPYISVPTSVEGDLFSLLGEVFLHTDFLLRSASIRADLGPNRTLTLSRPLWAVPLSSASVAQVIASAETLLCPERADG